jgi:glycerol-1-phosphate dehydrogenase [NAD(P)+]
MNPAIHIISHLFSQLDGLLAACAPSIHRWMIITDAACAAAYRITDAPFIPAYIHCFTEPPHATLACAEELTSVARCYQGIIAIGSGTINDLAKYAAHHAGIPYIIIASAPSMNGYISANASLLHHGHKYSFPATPPLALFADSEVLRHAPHRLIASGIGDVLCRSTVEADMHYACLMQQSDYPVALFATMREKEANLLDALTSANGMITDTLIHHLMACLLYGGQAMNAMGSSAPASQSEHMLVHVLEMLAPHITAHYFHGELVAAATLYARTLQERIKEHIFPTPIFPDFPFEEIRNLFGEDTAKSWQIGYAEKANACRQYQGNAREYSPILSAAQLTHYLGMAGCPVDLYSLFPPEILQHALLYVRFSRNRLTVWDYLACDFYL